MLELSDDDAIYLAERIERYYFKDFNRFVGSNSYDEVKVDIRKLQDYRIKIENSKASLKLGNTKSIGNVKKILNKYFPVGTPERKTLLSSMRKQRQISKISLIIPSKNKKLSESVFTSIRVSLKTKEWLEKEKEKRNCNSLDEALRKFKKRMLKKKKGERSNTS